MGENGQRGEEILRKRREREKGGRRENGEKRDGRG